MTTNAIPAQTLNNGTEMPALGYGVQTSPQETADVATEALRTPATGTSTPPPTARTS